MNVRRKYIRQVVEKLLINCEIYEPPVDVFVVAKFLKAEVVQQQHTDDELSGFLYKDPHKSEAIIGVNKCHHINRRRFTIAHELGHLMLHSFTDVHIDKSGSGGIGLVRLRHKLAHEGIDSDEVEANYFAAELLMPSSMLERDVKDIQNIEALNEKDSKAVLDDLAKKYQVSSQALNIRLVKLGLLEITI